MNDNNRGIKTKRLSNALMLNSFVVSVDPLLTRDTPKTNHDSGKTGEKRGVVRGLVAAQSVRAVPLAIRTDNRVLVVNASVKHVEDIATQDGRHGHCAPVLRKAADTECMGDQGWEDAEEEAVCDSCEARDENQCVRVVYAGACELGSRKDDCGNEQAPEA